MSKDFCSLHVHTSYSALDGASKIEELVLHAKAQGMSSLGISDHGVLAGIPEFYKTCKAHDIKSIIGQEFYWADDRLKKEGVKAKGSGDLDGTDKRYYHLSVYARDNDGYVNLMKLSTDAYINGRYFKPRSDYAMLEQHSKGIFVGSGCLGGPVNQRLLAGDFQGALETAARLQDCVGKDNFAIELMDHGLAEQRLTNPQLISIAKKIGADYYSSQDSHYTHKHQAHGHDGLLCVNTGSKMSDTDRFRFHNEEYYLKSPDEMYDLFREHPEACDNTLVIAEKCNVTIDFDSMHLPNFPLPEGFEDASAYLSHLVYERLEDFYQPTEQVVQRVAYELGVYDSMGVSSYMLIGWDLMEFARKQGMFLSAGRGCLTEDTLVQSDNGLIKLNEIKVGDRVVTHSGEYKNVLATHQYPIVGEKLLEIKSYYGGPNGVKMTLDHEVLAATSPKAALAWVKAEDLVIGDWMFVPSITREVEDVDIIDLASYAPTDAMVDDQYIYELTPSNRQYLFSTKDVKRRYKFYHSQNKLMEYVEKGWIIDDDVLSSPSGNNIRRSTLETLQTILSDGKFSSVSEWNAYIRENSFTKRTINRYVVVDVDYCEFIGRLCSNGWLCSGRVGYGIATQRSKDDGTTIPLVMGIFGEELTTQDSKTADLRQFSGNSRTVYNFLMSELVDYSFNAQTKHLPYWMVDLPDEKLRGLRDGLWWGDGSVSDRNKYTSTSWTLINQLYTILRNLGIPAGLSEDNRTDLREEFRNAGSSWCIVAGRNWGYSRGFSAKVDGGFLTKIFSIDEIDCGEFVYDITVEDDHSYLTTSGIVHNSAAGSIVARILGITQPDPIEYDLVFERFLNPSRIALPDIDMDFEQGRREEMINYTIDKYGKDFVSQIGTFGKVKARSAVRDSARVLGYLPKEGDRISKMIPPLVSGFDTSLVECFEESPSNVDGYAAAADLREDYKINPETKEIVDLALQFEGLLRSYGVHAAGVLIGDRPLNELVPLWVNKDGAIVSQYDKDTVEDLGLLKMDFLGLKNLDILAESERLVGGGFKISDQPMDNVDTFMMLSEGLSIGCFQIESSGMRSLLKRMRPDGIKDLSAVLALYRPGPMAQDWHNMYADRKNGRASVDYFHPDAIEILSDTYGIPLYQENLLFIARKFAGYDMAEADMLRKIIGKKKPEAMRAERAKFVDGCVANGYEAEFSENLFDKIEGFAAYGFNACIVGDTEIYIAGKNQHKTSWTVEEMYDRVYNVLPKTPAGRFAGEKYDGPCIRCDKDSRQLTRGLCRGCNAWRSKFLSGRVNVLARDESGRIKPMPVKDVHQNGVQKVWKVTLENGLHITATANHRHMLASGEWMEVAKLTVGDRLMISGGYDPVSGTDSSERSLTVGERSRTGRVLGAFGEDNYGFVDGGFVRFTENSDKLPDVCANNPDHLGRIEVAHLDGNRKNNEIDNLRKLCVSCHKTHDYGENNREVAWGKGHYSTSSKIVSIEYVGEEMTYDLEMATEEHCFVANGIVTHNSHSFSYAFITYWTAFMKANYPRQYMAALLTYSMDDLEKVALYIGEARRMGMKIYPPDVSDPQLRFTVEEDGIRVGMGTMKGVGASAIEKILTAFGGVQFDSLDDFVSRVNPQVGVLKALACSGALTQWGTRQGIFSIAQNILDQSRKDRKKISADQGAFDFGESMGFNIPEVEFSFSEILDLEKQYLGIYISGHPLDHFDPEEKQIVDILDNSEGWVDTVLAVVSGVETKTTKRGDKMANVVFEDQTGTLSSVVFAKSWSDFSNLLQVGSIVEIDLKVGWDSFREEKNFILLGVKDRNTVSESHGGLGVFGIHVPKRFKSNHRYMARLKNILLNNKGRVPAVIYISRSTTLGINETYDVNVTDQLKEEIKDLFVEFSKEKR